MASRALGGMDDKKLEARSDRGDPKYGNADRVRRPASVFRDVSRSD